jgi:hypothetical protein
VRIISIADWKIRESVSTPQGDWCGIAIGPRSDEGCVEVDGTLLQAGRVLPLRASTYTARKIRPGTTRKDRTGASEGAETTGTLASVATLELMLFENPCELAGSYPRADGRYDNGVGGSAMIDGSAVLVDRITVPFIGRRQCLFVLTFGRPVIFDYEVYGQRYSRSMDAVDYVTLKTQLAATASSDGTRSFVDPAGFTVAAYTYAFYIGGTDNAEAWDSLRLAIRKPTSDGNADYVWIEAQTIGELGAW